MAKAGFDPNQPRDEDGKWTDEGDASGNVNAAPDEDATIPTDAITINPTGTSGLGSGDNGGTIDDGTYHTTLDADGKPVLPTATPVQAELPPEEETTGEDGEEKEREDGIFGLTSEGERFVSAYNTLKQLDPNNEALQQKYLPADISSGAAADDLETASEEASLNRVLDRFMPNGQRLGTRGGTAIREASGGAKQAQEDFDYATVGARDITPPTYRGKFMALPGNIGTIGLRYESSDKSPAIDIEVPGILFEKVHYYE